MLSKSQAFVAKKYHRLSSRHYAVKMRSPFVQINHISRKEADDFLTIPHTTLFQSEVYTNLAFKYFQTLRKYPFVFAYFDTNHIKSKECEFLFKFVIITSKEPYNQYDSIKIDSSSVNFIDLMNKHYCFYARNELKSKFSNEWPSYSFYTTYCIPRLSKCEIEKIYSDIPKNEHNVTTERLCCIRIENSKDDYFTKKVYNLWRRKTYNINSKIFKEMNQRVTL